LLIKKIKSEHFCKEKTMKLDQNTAAKVAELARLKINPAASQDIIQEMNNLLAFVEKINEVDTQGVEPLTHCLENRNFFRQDKTHPSLAKSKIEEIAVEFEKDHFVIPQVIE
jgi:aspartyl-tRNA(Asn)/glutamyl-tRNA(Gln) amidotransferase subunit C